MASSYEELIAVPRNAVAFPLELPIPPAFVAEEPDTWPAVDGQLELVGGRLYFMPPSADRQQDTTMDVVTALGLWRRAHRDFVVEFETNAQLLDKARWYLAHGVEVVWLLSPAERRITVITRAGDQSFGLGETLPVHPALPELAPAIDELFEQVRDH